MENTETTKSAISQNQIDMFLASHGKKFSPMHFIQIKQELSKLTESQYQAVLIADYKDPTMLLVISLLVGPLGIDRFLLNDIGLGVGKLLTCGGCGIWTIVDWFLIQDRTREYNYNLFVQSIYGMSHYSN